MNIKRNLDATLLESKAIPTPMADEYHAWWTRAKGLYSTIQFVVRLNDPIHRLLSAAPSGTHASTDLSDETIQAFSTYLHETVHWWQHMGSTAGLVLSFAYPAQSHVNFGHLKTILRELGPKKPLRRLYESLAQNNSDQNENFTKSLTIAMNNAKDVEFYKIISQEPRRIPEITKDKYFESIGHSYWITYSQALAVISTTVDKKFQYLPDARNWEKEFLRLQSEKARGFVYRGEVIVPPVGLRALFEGQARFAQLQYLTFGEKNPLDVKNWAEEGYLNDVYSEAFDAFLKLSKTTWPEKIDDPKVGLFLLIIDLAINPTAGFPLNIEVFEDFILDVDPGIRFTRLCMAAAERPNLLTRIVDYSRAEYIEVCEILTKDCLYDHPIAALEKIFEWSEKAPGVMELLKEKESFEYTSEHIVPRVLFSHFVGFSNDKMNFPEFFCWTGAWMAGHRVGENSERLFLKYLSLYTNKEGDDGIFHRDIPGKNPTALAETLNNFYAYVAVYDMTRQWILSDGPFVFDYSWLSETAQKSEMVSWAKDLFVNIYGISPDEFEILT